MTSKPGVVVIGRNEGERLKRCLDSLVHSDVPLIYVDSQSTDGSIELAHQMGVDVLEMDGSQPMSAARSRNEGFAYLLRNHPDLVCVQFVDGDCEMAPDWLVQAPRALDEHEDWAIVCGKLRERDRNASIYNRLCDLEWDRPVGPIQACGGIFMIRTKAFEQVGGFDVTLTAGEEPDLCHRLRQKQWCFHRIDQAMAVHDADMHRFGQWWKRAVRSGRGYADALDRHGWNRSNPAFKATLSTWFWAVGLPLLILSTLWVTSGLSALLLVVYPIQIARIAWRECGHRSRSDAWLFAIACMVAKLPQVWGQILGLLQHNKSSVDKHTRSQNPQVSVHE